jgi:hypothetical protein
MVVHKLARLLAAAILVVAYLIVAPSPADLAAQAFRADLFSAHGYLIWNDLWYSGHSLLGYSILYPPLGALLGPRAVGAIAALAAAAAFAALARRRYGDRARLAIWWFGAATATNLVSGRITFALGLAFGLGTILALERRRTAFAIALAVATSLASPVAGLLLAFAAAVRATLGERRRAAGVAGAALATLLVLSLAFPTPGWFPFAFSAFLPAPIAALAVVAFVPGEERWLRRGAIAYAALCLLFALVHSPVGANATRLGSLFAGPLVALTLTGRRPVVLAALAIPLLYWQWVAPIRDFADQAGDPATHRSFFQPLVDKLGRVTHGRPVRVEIPPTHNRWESAYVAPRFPLARGWERQLEAPDIHRFTGGRLTSTGYRRWLDRRAVSYVAVADANLDYIAKDEVALIDRGLPYLRRVWRDADWTLYRVRDPAPLASRGARLARVGPADFALRPRGPGSYLVRIHYTPYWAVTSGSGCVAKAGPWTRVEAHRAGPISVAARFSVGGLFRHSRSC